MLCTNGHNNEEGATNCSFCGVNTFQNPGSPPVYPTAALAPFNGMAIASMVLGIVWAYWVGSILALVFGYVARNQIKQRGQRGNGMAIAGIVLGWVGVGTLILVIILAAVGSATSNTQ